MWFVILTFLLMIGVTTLWWSSIGLLRLVSTDRRSARHLVGRPLGPDDVAILVAARNEEMVIEATIRSACQPSSPRQVFIVSDASTDRTAEIARSYGARVMELVTNRGKAGAIVAGLRHFDIARRFRVVMLLDADSRPADDYLVTGLPLFQRPGVVAVAGRATTLHDSGQSWRGRILTSYRERTYVAVQTLHKFGQAASRANAVAIVPGFASMYRTEILEHVDIAAPGLAIEDYNMTFEIHAKRLGRVAFDPRAARAYTQDPDSLHEYVKQMSRWSLGFWQTVLRHRLQFQVFWIALVLFSIEVFVSSILLVVMVPVLVGDQLRELAGHGRGDRAGAVRLALPVARPAARRAAARPDPHALRRADVASAALPVDGTGVPGAPHRRCVRVPAGPVQGVAALVQRCVGQSDPGGSSQAWWPDRGPFMRATA
ncbi:glycosyltransferase family 2 protein [Aeromicrobium sp. UC242_57]|uniref:glycosyltransferase family 2 protein n=1 Tax=Aeromicrobium sp. UC242_57 TaxID=3374624 RepID=UPI0037B1DB56